MKHCLTFQRRPSEPDLQLARCCGHRLRQGRNADRGAHKGGASRRLPVYYCERANGPVALPGKPRIRRYGCHGRQALRGLLFGHPPFGHQEAPFQKTLTQSIPRKPSSTAARQPYALRTSYHLTPLYEITDTPAKLSQYGVLANGTADPNGPGCNVPGLGGLRLDACQRHGPQVRRWHRLD